MYDLGQVGRHARLKRVHLQGRQEPYRQRQYRQRKGLRWILKAHLQGLLQVENYLKAVYTEV